MMGYRLLMAAPFGVLLACAQPVADGNGAGGAAFADLTVQPTSLRSGAGIDLTLTNRSQQPIGYNLCTAALERRVGDDWQMHPDPIVEACTMELRVLQPGASDSFRHTLPAGLQPGAYRFWTGVEWPLGEDRVGIRSSEFQVTS